MDLGIKEKSYSPEAVPSPVAPGDKKEPRINYPSFDVRDEHADELRKEYGCDVDVTGTATVKFRISGDSKDQYSNRVTFEVQSLDDIKTSGDADDDDKGDEKPDAEEETLGYKRPKQSAKESPDISADSLKD